MSVSLNARQKIFIVVFIIAAGGLLFDRTILLPSQAQEAKNPDTMYPANSLVLSLNADAQQDIPGRRLTERLQTLYQTHLTTTEARRDGFTLSPSWNKAINGTGAESLSQTAAAFTRKYKLKAVISLGTQDQAFVNDRLIAIGDNLDGFTLTRLDEDHAVFERANESVSLALTKAP